MNPLFLLYIYTPVIFQGVDFPNVKIVCTVGLPSNIVDTLQRAGRAIRNCNGHQNFGLFVLFHEAWSNEIHQDDYEHTDEFRNDPDRPRAELRECSKRQERAPHSLIKLVQSDTCMRAMFAQYLDDDSDSGACSKHIHFPDRLKSLEIALEFTSPFCCERHGDVSDISSSAFRLQNYLPGPLFLTTGVKRKDPGPRLRNKYRKKADRNGLDLLLISWVLDQVKNDITLMRESIDILCKDQRKRLIFMHPKDITSRHDITRILDENFEWGNEFSESLFKLIQDYDEKLAAESRASKSARKAPPPSKQSQTSGSLAPDCFSDNDHSDTATQDEFLEGSSAALPIPITRSVRQKLSNE